MITKKIGIIGCGNMGEALLKGLSKVLEKSTSIMVSEDSASRRDYLRTKHRLIIEIDNHYLVKYSDVVIIAVKPKDYDAVLTDIRGDLTEKKLVISIGAGIRTKYIESIIGPGIAVIRMMPNMPAIIGEAISSLSAGKYAKKDDIALAEEIFSLIGEVVELDEKYIDAVTAISGSGPAYFFYLVETLIAAARIAGLKKDVAERLVLKTALGSAKLLEALKEDPGALRSKVTSKGGTTEAAFKIFVSKRFKETVHAAVRAAARRSRELAKG